MTRASIQEVNTALMSCRPWKMRPGRLEALARRHRRGGHVSAAAVRESARLLSGRMILAGKQSRAQGGVAPEVPPAHPLAAVLGESAGGNALSSRVCVCLSLYPVLHANTLLRTPTPVWSSLA
jgi:hypothetical protein